MMRTDYISEARKKAGQEVKIAGWVHEIRDIGKLIFIQLRDRTGIFKGSMGSTQEGFRFAPVAGKLA